jgi:hypothetical protein
MLPMAKGYVRRHTFKDHVTGVPEYKSIRWVSGREL